MVKFVLKIKLKMDNIFLKKQPSNIPLFQHSILGQAFKPQKISHIFFNL